ncbi:TetR/AcrR family transcriptional regulator [Pseudobacteriovorax antillogorgiicola]|uniref:Transcriptional regulator, TetR family n=1 Tax=Pseudobacteriovorax antillogorgiicola TaxID=1513793 RepID=A0A1Y6BK85_9BACT|nr:TetR family transcriptional regulator [Pseudobacteriovorax antillogorgiicola]TCS56279.1 TetR family transcriptional regulator [Pseudobacteriovorax antillogorgiicola]SMF07684.1 transcriptional regulator, TetR family [Pseudobacteriovorax antillogorgiicola]
MSYVKKEKATDKLKAAAISLFAEKGFHETSVRDIARQAGVNPSLINYHFGGKEDLYRSILEESGNESALRFNRILSEIDSRDEFGFRFKMLVEELVRANFDNFDVQRIIDQVIRNKGDIGEEVFREKHLKILEDFVLFIRSAQDKGFANKETDARLAALLVVAFIRNLGLMREALKSFIDIDIETPEAQKDIVDTLLRLVLTGLKAD